MKNFLMASVAFASLISGSAMAADMPVKAVYKAPPVYVYSWTGCYVGANAGGVWINKDYSLTSVGSASPFLTGVSTGANLGSHDANSWLGGFQAGCNYQFAGGWVVGLQGDYDWTNASGSHVDSFRSTWTDQSNTKSLGSVTGRLGYAWDRFLGYVKGGWAWERDNYNVYLNTTNTGLALASGTRGGWTVGVGGEYAFTNNLSAFVEYDYYDFGTKTTSFADNTGANFYNADIRERKSVVKAGLNWKFGGKGKAVEAYY
jgi:outer membrane immunogenic protein